MLCRPGTWLALPASMASTHFRCVFDAGHGGSQPAGKSSPLGTTGPGGLQEKDVTLSVASRLAQRLGGESAALLTRSGDYNLPLGQRAELARKHRADVFVSLHAGDGAHAEGGHAVLVHPAGPPSSW